jgi:hypothetical protein
MSPTVVGTVRTVTGSIIVVETAYQAIFVLSIINKLEPVLGVRRIHMRARLEKRHHHCFPTRWFSVDDDK